MNEALRQLVRDRAGNRCEYCQLPQEFDVMPFQVDHIIAEQHHGPTVAENLAWSCLNDNLRKGPNIAGLGPRDEGVDAPFPPSRRSVGRPFRLERPSPDWPDRHWSNND